MGNNPKAEIQYILRLPPITKKNSQQIMTNKATGRPFIMPSSKYRQYEKDAAWFLVPRPRKPLSCRLNIKCLFYMPTRRRTDLTNLLEAVDDLLVSAGIIEDDNYTIVAGHDGSRCAWYKQNPRTEITITRLPDDPADDPDQTKIF